MLHSLAALLVLCGCSSAVVIRDYNYVNFVQLGSFDEFSTVYLNTHKEFNQNVMLGVATDACKDKLLSPAFRGTQRHSGGAPVVTVTLPASAFPLPLPEGECFQASYYRTGQLLGAPSASTTTSEHQALNRWLAEVMQVKKMLFRNGFPYPIRIYWVEESTVPVETATLQPGASFALATFVGHVFSASALSPLPGVHPSAGEYSEAFEELGQAGVNIVDFMVVDGSDYEFRPLNRLMTCETDTAMHPAPGVHGVGVPAVGVDSGAGAGAGAGVVSQTTLDTAEAQSISGISGAGDCGNMYTRLVEFAHKVFYAKRLGLNFVQPQFVRAVTEVGFELRPLPADTYRWLRQWYDQERLRAEVLEGSSGPCMNQHVAPSLVTHLTGEHKDRLSRELRQTLEDWHGAPLTLTSIYGVRRYVNGSVLRMHVDTVNTHVVSAIINVDQQVDRDWPLLILDHEDNEHRVVMKPGDMVLYESAKLLHGRPDTFEGAHYDNIFIHYKPAEGWDYGWM